MRVLFYQRGQESIGVEQLMACLAHKGHKVDLAFDPGLEKTYFYDLSSSKIFEKIAKKRILKKVKIFHLIYLLPHAQALHIPTPRKHVN